VHLEALAGEVDRRPSSVTASSATVLSLMVLSVTASRAWVPRRVPVMSPAEWSVREGPAIEAAAPTS